MDLPIVKALVPDRRLAAIGVQGDLCYELQERLITLRQARQVCEYVFHVTILLGYGMVR
jgi:hypothetical protein